ncbi:translation initiation factor IF-2-like [Camelus ferus]|uniref:Translation initiation factor IF-2-like n=1 Tax=Camelus ferus TaxID=419612 RepID=A0A8B8S5A8_CAMFR|nr:translation initiation factor IF-2-like [Camelus ferus]
MQVLGPANAITPKRRVWLFRAFKSLKVVKTNLSALQERAGWLWISHLLPPCGWSLQQKQAGEWWCWGAAEEPEPRWGVRERELEPGWGPGRTAEARTGSRGRRGRRHPPGREASPAGGRGLQTRGRNPERRCARAEAGSAASPARWQRSREAAPQFPGSRLRFPVPRPLSPRRCPRRPDKPDKALACPPRTAQNLLSSHPPPPGDRPFLSPAGPGGAVGPPPRRAARPGARYRPTGSSDLQTHLCCFPSTATLRLRGAGAQPSSRSCHASAVQACGQPAVRSQPPGLPGGGHGGLPDGPEDALLLFTPWVAPSAWRGAGL